MKKYKFWIRRTRNGRFELVTITAADSMAAVNKLPTCAYWDFSK